MTAVPGQMRFDYVSPQTIKHDAPQVRRDWRHDNGMDKLKGLEQSIRQEGILQPLLVRPLPVQHQNGYLWELIAGHGRLVCGLRIPLPAVPVLIHPVNDADKPLVQLLENHHRRQLAALDEAVAMRDLMAARGWTQARLADALAVSQSLVSQRIGLLRQELLRDALERGLIAAHTATLLRQLSDDDQSRPLYARLERGEKVAEPDVRAARACQQDESVPSGRPQQLGLPKSETQDKIERALALRASGLNQFEIAAELGLSRPQVNAYLLGHEAAERHEPEPQEGPPTRADLRRRAHRLRDGGASLAAIGVAMGIGRGTVEDLLALPAVSPVAPAVSPVAPGEPHEGSPTPPLLPGAPLIDRLPPEQAEALRDAVGPAVAEPSEDSSNAGLPVLPEPEGEHEPHYGRNPEHVVVEAPPPRTALRREPTLADLLEPLRHGPCWLPLGRLLVKASIDGLSATEVLAAYRAQQ